MEKERQEMEKYAQEYKIPIMQPEGIEFLTSYIKDHSVTSILEIGSAIGYSAIRMAQIDDRIHIVTVERDEVRYKEAVRNIQKCNMEKQIKIFHADALEFEIEEKFDLIFIDAAKAQYSKFFERYAKNLEENGVIVSDNLKFHGFVDTQERIKNRNTRQLVNKIKKYIEYLQTHPEYETTFYDIGDGIAITKKSLM